MRYYLIFILLLAVSVVNAASSYEAGSAANAQSNSQYSDARQTGAALKELGLTENCSIEPVFNGRACVYETGNIARQTVVLVHGLNSSAAVWYEQVKALKNKFHVVTFDLPGFGKSSSDNQLYSPTNFARFVHHVVKKHVNKPFYLVGHSMGGAIALRYSAMHPHYVKRLILTDAGGILHEFAFAKNVAFKWIKRLQQMATVAIPGLQDMPAIHEMANIFFQKLDGVPVDIRDALRIPELRQIILKGNSIPIAGAALSVEDFSGAIRNNNIPTLIIWGTYDLITPVRTATLLEARMPNSYLRILDRSAHSGMVDEPAKFNRLMLEHFTATESELEKRYWHFPAFKESERIGLCNNETEKIFEGNYQRIELTNCKKAIIKNANIGSIIAKNSYIEIEKSQIVSKDIGLVLYDSTIYVTGSLVSAKIAVQSVRSHMDFAGVDFKIDDTTINNLGQSDVVFSVSTINGKSMHRYEDLTVATRY